MVPVSAEKWCIINTTMHYLQFLDLVPSKGRKQSTCEWIFWNNTQAVSIGKIWRGKLKLAFHATVSKLSFETDNCEWRGPVSHHHRVGIRKKRVFGLSSAWEKGNRVYLEQERGKRYLMKAKETSCPNPLRKKRQREWVCWIKHRPKNNVSIIL